MSTHYPHFAVLFRVPPSFWHYTYSKKIKLWDLQSMSQVMQLTARLSKSNTYDTRLWHEETHELLHISLALLTQAELLSQLVESSLKCRTFILHFVRSRNQIYANNFVQLARNNRLFCNRQPFWSQQVFWTNTRYISYTLK